ncbi:nucleotidyltransferase family protein [Roseovarius rhodophyticola]|uniref:Nucleotidyltransferase family protein n=1 Tax=Roseovarius rhodophyticola TaxID=3080827 RepID=A0ABZ2TFS5_9RHOB|nr:nucleotidyltransferase family protein [Roseovarius sp. W115]MDV2928387.1 nucleotidyltransferase family protein [Roseovarius sp. W115]
MSLVCLVPAAGASTRMRGRDKLLEKIDGVPLLARQTSAVMTLGVPVLITLPAQSEDRVNALQPVRDDQVTLMNIADADEGLSASIRMGANWAMAQGATALMVALPDLPDVCAEDFATLHDTHRAHPDAVIRATTAEGQTGHPTVLPARLFGALARLTGDQGAKALLRNEPITPCPLPGKRAVTDLDTPEAWEAWRALRVAKSKQSQP